MLADFFSILLEGEFMLKRGGQSWRVLVLLGAMAWLPTAVHAEPARWNVDPESPALLDQLALMEEGGRPDWYARDDH